MKSIVIHAPKDLRITEQEPGEPGPGEVAIRIAVGGVCGSDLHYYNHGGFGSVRLREPMILGHEVSGYIDATGHGVQGLAVGDLVAISPSRPCGDCEYCDAGLPNHCLNMRFYGSAMPFPHIQGAFRELLIADASQCAKADGLSAGEAAMAEPLSVALHAVVRAGDLAGKRVLVTGCGPIGALCILAARDAGATEIIATDLTNNALSHAAAAGASTVVNVATDAGALDRFRSGKGTIDVLFECSGAQAALGDAVSMLRPRGVIVQLGLGGDMTLPVQTMTAKEIDLRGSFRFHEEFPDAVAAMQSRRIDVRPLITHTFGLSRAEDAFLAANDRSSAMKTQIEFPRP